MNLIDAKARVKTSDAETRKMIALLAAALKGKIHGPGHSADWVHGYWKACEDVAATAGFRISRAPSHDD